MREFDALRDYPVPLQPRVVGGRDIHARLTAAQRGREFFDGARVNGYGGLKDDGRWHAVAEFMVREYGLSRGQLVLQIQAEKGFLLDAFVSFDMRVRGTETSLYAIEKTPAFVTTDLVPPYALPYEDHRFDLVIAIGAVYTLSLGDAVRCLREIERVGRGKSFITLAAYDSEDDLRLLRAWSLLGTTILPRSDWLTVLKYAGYTGDYSFVTAQSLGLAWS